MKKFFANPYYAEKFMTILGIIIIAILTISCILIISPLDLGTIILPRIGNCLLIISSFLLIQHFRFSKADLEITACWDITLMIFFATLGTMLNRVLIDWQVTNNMGVAAAINILVACYLLNGVCFRSNLYRKMWFLTITVMLSFLMYIAYIYNVMVLAQGILLVTALVILFYSIQLIRQTDYNILGVAAIVFCVGQIFAATQITGNISNLNLYLIPDIQSICYCLILFSLANCSRVGHDKVTGNPKHF